MTQKFKELMRKGDLTEVFTFEINESSYHIDYSKGTDMYYVSKDEELSGVYDALSDAVMRVVRLKNWWIAKI